MEAKFLATLNNSTKADMAESAYCPYELYVLLRVDADTRVRAGAARNVVLATPYINQFLSDASELVRDACISTQRLIDEQIWNVLRDPSVTWRNIGTLAQHHKFTRKQVKYLFKDMCDALDAGDCFYSGCLLDNIFGNEGVRESDILNYLTEDESYGAKSHAIKSGKLSEGTLEQMYFVERTHMGMVVEVAKSQKILADAKAKFEADGSFGEQLLSNPYVDKGWKIEAADKVGTVYAYKVAKGGC